ncbi:hypothetical protein [Brevundimonas sp. A19_0]|uniref:hypothetical protein n=1 Tax=Brevundimonas sp. A19_0 TaxID=2821087 RepID=UPI001ADD3713|nr:hypothetical protein [Brevundimonas sp. A19_0]MBO9501197.1 hypothetical protein [Brevundimonas sp. A19_0]
MRIKMLGVALAASFAASGCATATGMLYSEDRLAQMAAAHFGVDASQIEISRRDPQAGGTYFTVTLPDGKTERCFSDGNAMGFGLTHNALRCGQQMNERGF